jgi:hypothetical protein
MFVLTSEPVKRAVKYNSCYLFDCFSTFLALSIEYVSRRYGLQYFKFTFNYPVKQNESFLNYNFFIQFDLRL